MSETPVLTLAATDQLAAALDAITWTSDGAPAIHLDDVPAYERALAELATSRQPRRLEVRVERGGADRWHSLALVPLDDGSWCAIAIDIHDTMVASARAAANQQRLDRLLHDLLTPLSTLLLWDGVLRSGGHDPRQRQEALAAIHRSAKLQARLVGDFRDAMRAQSGRLVLARERVAISELVHAAVSRASAEMPHPLALDLRVQPDLWVIGDAGRLAQALDRLIAHAIELAAPDARLALELGVRARELVLEVCVRHAALDPDAPDARPAGQSIGIAVARELLELHGGALAIDGGGAILRAHLPITV